ncbi:hypothetical protein SDC9_129876 [bioreactor metagenome]|uniref:Uncharacterized protein n=1 Tax=bioreactor metagenome TaxID=1076179 RepID=A0A645D0R5_9ZZZZ
MILKGFVDIHISCRGSIKTSKELIHYNEQLHLCRFFDEFLLHFMFEFLDSIHCFFWWLMEVIGQHLLVNLEPFQFFRISIFSSRFPLDISDIWIVTGDDGTFLES